MGVPVALTVAGSDCSAGAGLQADLKTFAAFRVYGLTAVTCVVAEVPGKVTRIEAVPPDHLAEQIALLLDAFPVGAVKTGMLYSAAHIDAVAEVLESHPKAPRRALVVDPVMVATSGDSLLQEDAIARCRERLFPLAALVTPNADEAAVLLGRAVEDPADDAQALAELLGAPVLLKGGHLTASPQAIDRLADPHGASASFAADFVQGVHTHGTGCTYSAAIAAGLAQGRDLNAAIIRAKSFVTKSIREYLRWPGDLHALNHDPDFADA